MLESDCDVMFSPFRIVSAAGYVFYNSINLNVL